jgi:hypothetical protein
VMVMMASVNDVRHGFDALMTVMPMVLICPR